ncbi:MAG: hypothetical protein R2883_07820 [Caldisericia bacterium]
MKRMIIVMFVSVIFLSFASCGEIKNTDFIKTSEYEYDYEKIPWPGVVDREDLSKTAREKVLEKDGFFPELSMSWSNLTLDEIWLEYKKALDENSYVPITRKESSNSSDTDILDLQKFYSTSITPEANSYWPERHLGKLKYIPFEEMRVFISENVFENIQELVTFYFDKTFNGSLDMIDETGSQMPLNYDVFPINKNIWVLNIYRYGSSDSLQYFSIFEISDDNKIYQLTNWMDCMASNYVTGIADINNDGYTELIHKYLWVPEYNIITYRQGKLELIIFDIDGMRKVDSFLGFDNGYAHFTTSNLGYAIYSLHEDAGHSMADIRFSGEHVLQIRGEDVYDVTYRYPGDEIMQSLAKIRDERFEYFDIYKGFGIDTSDVCNLEAVGLTKEIQHSFINRELPEGDRPEDLRYRDKIKIFKPIIDFCYKNNKPYHVQNNYDVPKSINEDWYWFKLITH